MIAYDESVHDDAVFDTSFWINAHRSGLLPYVLARFTLWYTRDVAAEMKATFASGQDFHERVRRGELHEVALPPLRVREFGFGERTAMTVALEHPDWFLLLDDYRPYVASAQRGLKAVCTPMLTVMLLREGALDDEQAMAILARLESLRTVSPRLVDEALDQYVQWLGE